MEKPARPPRNYQWAVAGVAGIVLVIGAFAFYALGIIRAHQEETNRQIFRGLSVIASDISENLETLARILPAFQPDGFETANWSLTGEIQPFDVLLPSTCNQREALLVAFQQNVVLRSCGRQTRGATISMLDPDSPVSTFRAGLLHDFNSRRDDLRQTPSYRAVNISPLNVSSLSSSECRANEVPLLELKQPDQLEPSVVSRICASPSFDASLSIASLVDRSYVDSLVDVVMIADARGTVLSETDNQTFARLTSIAPYLGANGLSANGVANADNDKKAANADPRLFPGTQSTIVPIDLSGRRYQLFVQPQVLSLATVGPAGSTAPSESSGSSRFYVVGIARAPGLLDSLGSLPVRVVGGVLGLLAVLLISLPIAKLGLIGADEKLHPRDAFLTFGSVLMIAAGLTVVVLDFAAYSAMREQMNGAAKSIATQITHKFEWELAASLSQLDDAERQWKNYQKDDDELGKSNRPGQRSILSNNYPPYQRFTVRDENSNVMLPQLRYQEREERTNVLDRPYFQSVLGGRLWTAADMGSHFVLDRVRSRTSGEKLYVLAAPSTEVKESVPALRVMTLVKNFLTFRSPVLPPFYKFAVFDNATGTVIQHSDDTQSLLENFYAEFSARDELRAAVAYQRSTYIDGDYRGTSTGLFVQPLGTYVPWSVAVFYDKNAIQGIHFDVAAIALIILAGFVLIVMVVVIISHYLSREPRWMFAYQQPSLTMEYVWLALVFVSHAALMLLSIQYLQVSATMTFLAPLLVWPLLYLTLVDKPRSAWAIGLAWLVLIADLALSASLIYGVRQSSAFWISVAFLWMISLLVVFPKLRSALRRLTILEPLLSTFDSALSKARTAVIGERRGRVALALAGFLIFAVVVIGAYRAANLIVMSAFLIWVALLLLGIPALADPLRRPLARMSGMWTRRREQWNRAAYFSLGLATLLLAGVVPAAGVFHEMFDVQMDTLTRYGQAHLASAYRERFRTLQSDVARIEPGTYSRTEAPQIVVEPHDSGIYVWRTRLFPSDQPSDGGTADTWYVPPLRDTSELYAATTFGRPVGCGNESSGAWRLTAWAASRIPGLDNTTALLRQLLPIGQSSAGSNCWEFADKERLDMQPIGGWPSGALPLVWFGIAMMIVIGGAGLWFIIGLAARQFLACAIDHPGENWKADRDREMTRLAKKIEPGRLHLFIGMTATQLDEFKDALKGKSVLTESCIEKRIYEAGRKSAIWSKSGILLLTDIELALGSDRQLTGLLTLLEERNAKKLTTVILSDVDPIDAITHPDHYADFSDRKPTPDAEQVARWIWLLNKSSTQYLREHHSSIPNDPLARETHAFAELKKLEDQIRPLKLTEGEMVERVRRHAHGFYESLWRLCSKKERVILYRLAQGYLINPANAHDLVDLLNIGILRRDPAIRLPNESIKRFILSAETPERIEAWARGGKASAWSIVRLPLIGLILMLMVVITLMGKETTDYVLGLLGAMAALLPLVFNALGSLGSAKSNSSASSAG